MKVFKTLSFLIFIAAIIGVIYLFIIQNLDQTIELGLNLGPLGAWRFKEAQPAVYLMLGAFASGLVAVGLFAVYEVIRYEQRTRRLKRIISRLQATQDKPPAGD